MPNPKVASYTINTSFNTEPDIWQGPGAKVLINTLGVVLLSKLILCRQISNPRQRGQGGGGGGEILWARGQVKGERGALIGYKEIWKRSFLSDLYHLMADLKLA